MTKIKIPEGGYTQRDMLVKRETIEKIIKLINEQKVYHFVMEDEKDDFHRKGWNDSLVCLKNKLEKLK